MTSYRTTQTSPEPRVDAARHQAAVRAIVAPFDPMAYVYSTRPAVVGEEEGELRARHAIEQMQQQGASPEAQQTMASALAAVPPAPATLAAFVDADGAVVYQQMLPEADIADASGWASPAPLVPLLAWGQDRPAHLLVVTDRAGADITISPGAGLPERTETVVGPDDEIARKHGPGGWSEPSYRGRVEDSWRRNAASIAKAVLARAAAVDAQVLVCSGDVRAVQLLLERLPNDPALLVRHITGSRTADGSQPDRADRLQQVLRSVANEHTAKMLGEFREQLGPGALSVEGVGPTLDALARGRVATLLVEPLTADTRTAWYGMAPTAVYRDHESALLPGLPVRRGLLVDVMVRSVLLSGGQVRVVPPGTPGAPADGIGGLCRFTAQ